MGWNFYSLDQIAQKLVLAAKERDPKSLNQAFKMRQSVAYGLERFWGEQLRFQGKEPDKSQYWQETWNEFVKIMGKAGVVIANDKVKVEETAKVKKMAEKLWEIEFDDQTIALSVLTQLCDSLVWWTQRYK